LKYIETAVCIVGPHRSTTSMRPLVKSGLSVVCQSVTIVRTAKTAEPIEMPFGLWYSGGPNKPCIRWAADPSCKGEILRGKSGPL